VSDPRADEASTTDTPPNSYYVAGLEEHRAWAVARIAELESANAELERREALLTEFAKTAKQYDEGYYAQMGETDAGIAMFEAFQALHLAGFPWTEGKS
jgi:hypothetical protein